MNPTALTDLNVTRLSPGSGPAHASGTAGPQGPDATADTGGSGDTSFGQALCDAGKAPENKGPDGTGPASSNTTPAATTAPQAPPTADATGAAQPPAATAADLLLASLSALEPATGTPPEPAPAATAERPSGEGLPDSGKDLPPGTDPQAALLALATTPPTATPATPPSPVAPITGTPEPADDGAPARPDATAMRTPLHGLPPSPGPLVAANAPAPGDDPRAAVNTDADPVATGDGAELPASAATDATTLAPSRDAIALDGFRRLLAAAGIVVPGAGGADAAPTPVGTSGVDPGTLAFAATPLATTALRAPGGDVGTAAVPGGTAQPSLQPLADHGAWTQSLGERVLLMADQGLQQATLRLEPEHLGPLQIHIQVDDGVAQVSFSAHHPDTRAALGDALPRLREMFSEQGLTLLQANVDAGGGRAGYPPADPARPWDTRGNATTPRGDDAVNALSRARAWQVSAPGSRRIDLLV